MATVSSEVSSPRSSLLFSFMNSCPNSCIFELNELKDWYEKSFHKKEFPLKDLLDQLIKEGKIKTRKVLSFDIYWPLPLDVTKKEDSTTLPSPLKRPYSHSLLSSEGPRKKLKSINVSRPTLEGTSFIIAKEKKLILGQLAEKEKRLQKLRLVKLYRTKNDLNQLEALIEKWRCVSQEAAQTLLELSPVHSSETPPSMTDLLNYLHINTNTIQYSIEDESFY